MKAVPLWLALFISLVGCTQPTTETATSLPSLADIERDLANDYALNDPIERQRLVLQHTALWLQTDEVQALTDAEASQIYTQLAFSSGNIIFDDPAFIDRSDGLVVFGLPNGLGIYIFLPDGNPVRLTEYSIGLNDLSVTWLEGEFGVAYETLDAATRSVPHFALVTLSDEAGWQVSWLSDNVADWWFNALDGELIVADDLQTLTVTGQSLTSPIVFDESASEVTRTYTLTWRRDILRGEDRQGYVVSPLPESYNDRVEWMWSVATPSDYATLVEFIEQLQLGREERASTLAANGFAFRQATDFGFDQPGRQYTVQEAQPNSIVVQGEQGTFTFFFDTEHRIADIRPIGAENDR